MTVKLYHAHISTCSQKVRFALAEKGVAYDSQVLNLRAGEQYSKDYRRLNPNAVVPTLLNGDDIIRESTIINEYIEDAFAGPPLLPAQPAARAAVRLWTKQLDEGVHAAIVVLSFCIAFRNDFLSRTDAEMQEFFQRMDNPQRQKFYQSAIALGLDYEEVPQAIARFQRLIRDMESALAGARWLVGDDLSLADIGFIPYLLRLDHLGLAALWSASPRVADWYSRVKQRPAYTDAIEAWLAAPAVEGMQKAGAEAGPIISTLLAD